MVRNIVLTSLVLLSSIICLFGQNKYEKESRAKRRDLPANALSFMDSLNLDVKVRWFKEEGLSTKSFEAKFKRNKANYSVEFDSMGQIEDVEIELNWDSVHVDLRDSMEIKLRKFCSSYSFSKIQKQFSGNINELSSIIKNGMTPDGLKMNYEIIVRCKQLATANLCEYLFDERGKLLSISKIVFKNSSHLEY